MYTQGAGYWWKKHRIRVALGPRILNILGFGPAQKNVCPQLPIPVRNPRAITGFKSRNTGLVSGVRL